MMKKTTGMECSPPGGTPDFEAESAKRNGKKSAPTSRTRWRVFRFLNSEASFAELPGRLL
jgi:hypothetical protein